MVHGILYLALIFGLLISTMVGHKHAHARERFLTQSAQAKEPSCCEKSEDSLLGIRRRLSAGSAHELGLKIRPLSCPAAHFGLEAIPIITEYRDNAIGFCEINYKERYNFYRNFPRKQNIARCGGGFVKNSQKKYLALRVSALDFCGISISKTGHAEKGSRQKYDIARRYENGKV
ncbi:MAG: hypothetical protein PHD32_09265 [Eubacteriales bacterium]|nr:hypothetical protein [Eubacteriales bacterium]